MMNLIQQCALYSKINFRWDTVLKAKTSPITKQETNNNHNKNLETLINKYN